MTATLIAFRPPAAARPTPDEDAVPLSVSAKINIADDLDAIARRNSAARDLVSAAMQRWMQGETLDARDQRLVDLVVDTNWASQLGRLCIPQGGC